MILEELIRSLSGRRMPPHMGLHLLHALAVGMEKIHDIGEYHGDLHSENIIVSRFGLRFELKLLDMHYWGAPLTLARFDTVLLCSDGLTDNLALEAIGARVRSEPLGRAVDALGADCERAMAAESGHPDDLTLLLNRASTAKARAP